MTRRKQGLGLLGLLAVAALGVMAFAATAQAVLVPQFTIGGAAALHASATGVTDEGGTQKLLVPNSNLTLICKSFEVIQGLILTPEDADATLLYKECNEVLEHKASGTLPCHVSDVAGGKPELLHVTASALLLPIEFKDGTFGILAEKLKVQINFLSGTGCPIPLKNVVTGEACFKITAGNDTNKPLILSNPKIQEECPPRRKLEGLTKLELEDEEKVVPTFKDELKFGANPATIEGAAILSLLGAHEGKTLGVLLD